MALSRAYDPIFRRHAGSIPVNYLRALAKRESNLNPREAIDPAWGLMQVVPQVRISYNQRHGTSYSQAQLLEPETNVKIATELLRRIVRQYGKHPAKNLKENWHNPEFVKLVTAGWNSGYSEAAGVGRVASYLESRGIPVTHDAVFEHAAAAGGTRHLQNRTKYAWQRSVADLFYAEGGPGTGVLLPLALTLVGAWAIYKLMET